MKIGITYDFCEKNKIMKILKLITLIIMVFLIFGCAKKKNTEESESAKDVIFTDSFSPLDWENPINRKQLLSGDKDIGNFIKEDVTDPKLRNTLLIVKNFVNNLKNTNKTEFNKIMSLSLYNSFILRYSDISFNENYELRVEHPQDLTQNNIWIKFKVKTKDKTYLGRLYLEYESSNCKISDYDDMFFTELKKSIQIKDPSSDKKS